MKKALVLLCAAALSGTAALPAQAPVAASDHEQAVRAYVDAERALRLALRQITCTQQPTPDQRAEVERLARARDAAERRVHESALVTGKPVPDLGSELSQPVPSPQPEEIFPRVQRLESMLRARDVRRLVVRVHLPREV
jgi:hypothetical protein